MFYLVKVIFESQTFESNFRNKLSIVKEALCGDAREVVYTRTTVISCSVTLSNDQTAASSAAGKVIAGLPVDNDSLPLRISHKDHDKLRPGGWNVSTEPRLRLIYC